MLDYFFTGWSDFLDLRLTGNFTAAHQKVTDKFCYYDHLNTVKRKELLTHDLMNYSHFLMQIAKHLRADPEDPDEDEFWI